MIGYGVVGDCSGRDSGLLSLETVAALANVIGFYVKAFHRDCIACKMILERYADEQ